MVVLVVEQDMIQQELLELVELEIE